MKVELQQGVSSFGYLLPMIMLLLRALRTMELTAKALMHANRHATTVIRKSMTVSLCVKDLEIQATLSLFLDVDTANNRSCLLFLRTRARLTRLSSILPPLANELRRENGTFMSKYYNNSNNKVVFNNTHKTNNNKYK